MIDRVIAFALHQRFITLALALLLTVGGIVSYHRLPIEAYPDVGDVKVEVITLWPGHAAEEVERLLTIPLENELNGIANVTFLRSDTLFGLSNIQVLFADGTDNYWARQQAQERIAQAALPADVKPALGPMSSVIGTLVLKEIPKRPETEIASSITVRPPVFDANQILGVELKVPNGGGGSIHCELPQIWVGFFTPSVKVVSMPSRFWLPAMMLPDSGGALTYMLIEPSVSVRPPWFAIIAQWIVP